MKELVSIETGKGRRKKIRVFFKGQEVLPRKDLSKENQGRRLAPKPPIYGEEKKKHGSDQERFQVSTKYGIVPGSYEPSEVVENDMVEAEISEEQRMAQARGEEKDIRRRIL